MNFANPTLVQIGMSATFVGIRYRVVGRAVMGMEDGGEIYYWQEFNLAGDSGQSATLVYERTEQGPDWKLFTLFEPPSPMTVDEARSKKIRDRVNIDGETMMVTLVDESRVYFMEGITPEGMEMGDIAHYFNAERPKKMSVVSWTGDEIEFYHGMNLPRDMVPRAFGLLKDVPESHWPAEKPSPRIPWAKIWVGSFAALIVALIVYPSCQSKRRTTGIVKQTLVETPFAVGRRGRLSDRFYRITGIATVEIAQVGRLEDRYEYTLTDDDGNTALLVHGFTAGARDWFLLTPFEPAKPMTGVQAAKVRVGDSVAPDGVGYEVSELFRATILRTQGSVTSAPTNGTVFYGFNAGRQTYRVLARWTEGSITFSRGKAVDEKNVNAAFK